MATRSDLRQETRQRVLAAAERLFATRGFKATTVRDIAHDVGVSVGTVMSVGDKSALLVTIFDRKIRHVHAERREDAPQVMDDSADPAGRIMDLISPFVRMFTERAALSREYGAVLMSGSHSSEVFQELADDVVREIETAVAASGAASREAATAARTIYLSYLGLIFVWAGTGDDGESDFTTHLGPIVRFVLQRKGK